MSQINVLVVAVLEDVATEGFEAEIRARTDMALVGGRIVDVAEAAALLESLPASAPCAVVLVGNPADTEAPSERWVSQRSDLVVLRVDPIENVVRMALRSHVIGLPELIEELRSLVARAGAPARERILNFQLREVRASPSRGWSGETPDGRPLLAAAMAWIHEVLREAVARQPGGEGDVPGLTVTAATLEQSLLEGRPERGTPGSEAVRAADGALIRALAAADMRHEPLAAAARVLDLSDAEFRLLLLALSPELDPRYQRCFGLLLDDMSRRVGTLGLYASLLGEASQVRRQLARAGNLVRWRLLEGRGAGLPPADEPLRLDPHVAGWLLGERFALDHDPRVRRALRLARWPGASLLDVELDRVRAVSLVSKLDTGGDVQWILFAGPYASGWRALLELGAEGRQTSPIRVEAARLSGLDPVEVEESGLRLGRMARLGTRPLIVDMSGAEAVPQEDEMLRVLLASIGATGARSGVVCSDAPRVVRLLGSAPFALTEGAALHAASRAAIVRAAARSLDTSIKDETARAVAQQYPLQPDGIEHAMRIARAARLPHDSAERRFERFVAACKDVAAEGVTQFADRIDPVFELDDVVLPEDRKRQLQEIVDSVRLSSRVLDEWKFREKLPYGRGTTALFHGPSGCGKTMSALAVAKALGVGNGRKSGVPVLRVELSRLVSKYIGDTPKNIDRVFADARRSGAAILVDEADALLQRRSAEPRDSNDRNSALEVAYLLQKIEDLHDDGLVILTTNLRQNIDTAFLRRLRFIVEFPRPDAAAREQIWRRCLPEGFHTLDDGAFRQLARKIELAGGNIRQITLRAAFIAAAADARIGLEHVVYASQAELAKLGMPAVAIELPNLKAA